MKSSRSRMVSRMRLVLAQILAQTRQTSLLAIVNIFTVAYENAGIALRGISTSVWVGVRLF